MGGQKNIVGETRVMVSRPGKGKMKKPLDKKTKSIEKKRMIIHSCNIGYYVVSQKNKYRGYYHSKNKTPPNSPNE